jgi:hypothetical protein
VPRRVREVGGDFAGSVARDLQQGGVLEPLR